MAAERSSRIAAVGYDYASQPKVDIERCNLCDGAQFTVVAHVDRYGYPAAAHLCDTCGLVFLNPVMASAAYQQFYVDVYRPLVSAFHGRLIDARTIQAEQRDYARERAELLRQYLRGRANGRLLDIGGSTGVVSHAWCREFNLKGVVIDPSPLEISEAQALGLETVTGFVEEWDGGQQQFDVIAMCQTVDHLLDVMKTLTAVRHLLVPDGIFFVDIVDFRAAYLRNWSVEAAVKIDHPYYFTESTMTMFLRRAGFAAVRTDYAADHLHVSYVCRPAAPEPMALPDPGVVSRMMREIRYVQNTAASR
ncbi:MAG TPA: class I SAM-dependent methyltransferase [Vicinamibacterales bacterium]|nr:class I SAM-dependent methyltransferase [Vicinamibacterales bacterium]